MTTSSNDLLTVIGADTKLTWVAGTRGGEFAGSCSFCGGDDRLRVHPHWRGGEWWCRNCSPDNRWQSLADYLIKRDGISFKEAQEQLGLAPSKPVQADDPHTYPDRHGATWADFAKFGAKRDVYIDYSEGGKEYDAIFFNDATGGRYRVFRPKNRFVPVKKGQPPCWYGLAEAVQLANATGQDILYLVNGQPSVIACHAHGIPAFTVPGGEGNLVTYMSQGLIPELKALWGKRLRVVLDGDKQGYKSAPEVVDFLKLEGYNDAIALDPGKGNDAADLCVANNSSSTQAFQGLPLLYPLPNTPVSPPGSPTTTPVGPAVEHCSDLGNARRLVKRHGANLHYVGAWGCWLIWDGTRWLKDETGAIQRLARETVANIYVEASMATDLKDRKALAEWALASESKSRLEAMVALAQDEPGIHIRHEALDANPWFLNVHNGVINLQTGKLEHHNRDYLITKCLNVDYEAQSTAPVWQAFIERVMGSDSDLIEFVQRAIGYSLTGDVSEQCLFFLYGSGRNGKSTFTEIILTLLGDYAQKAPTEMLMARQNGIAIPNDIARLPGSRFVVAAEVEEGRRLAESIIKDLTGGDRLIARFMRAEFFEFTATHKLWLFGNHKPQIKGTDDGIWRRIRLIPFNVAIPPNERDAHLKEKLTVELPGILNWALEGLANWHRNGLGSPSAVERATNAYRQEMDLLGAYIGDNCLSGPEFSAAAGNLYADYQRWSESSGENAISQRRFGMQLTERGFERYRSNGQWRWRGIGLLLTTTVSRDSDPSDPSDPDSGMSKTIETHEPLSRNQDHLDHLDHSPFPDQYTGPATWANKDQDSPVQVIGYWAAELSPDGRRYARITGSKTGVPVDELSVRDADSDYPFDRIDWRLMQKLYSIGDEESLNGIQRHCTIKRVGYDDVLAELQI